MQGFTQKIQKKRKGINGVKKMKYMECIKVEEFLIFSDTCRVEQLGTLRYGDYGLRTTVGRKIFLLWSTGPSTQRVARKYEVKIADYRQRTTNKARSKLQEKLASLFIYILRPECLFEKVEMPMFSL